MNAAKLFDYYGTFPMHKPSGSSYWELVQTNQMFYYVNEKERRESFFLFLPEWTKRLQSFFSFPLVVIEEVLADKTKRSFQVFFLEGDRSFSFDVKSEENRRLYFNAWEYEERQTLGENYNEKTLQVGKEFIRLLAQEPAYRLYEATGSLEVLYIDFLSNAQPCDWFRPLEENF